MDGVQVFTAERALWRSQRVLLRAGYAVLVASDGEEALELSRDKIGLRRVRHLVDDHAHALYPQFRGHPGYLPGDAGRAQSGLHDHYQQVHSLGRAAAQVLEPATLTLDGFGVADATLGVSLGLLGGGGSILASFASYSVEKRISRHPERFGKGAIEGVAGPGPEACGAEELADLLAGVVPQAVGVPRGGLRLPP